MAANFDIDATHIHAERFIGRVRDWSILNAVWPFQRIDIYCLPHGYYSMWLFHIYPPGYPQPFQMWIPYWISTTISNVYGYPISSAHLV